MKYLRAVNRTRCAMLGARVGLADRWWSRAWGLLGRRALAPEGGLLLRPCRGVHMFGMAFPVDVAFVGRAGDIVALYHGLAPGRRTRWHHRAHEALELPAGRLAATGSVEGDIVGYSMDTDA